MVGVTNPSASPIQWIADGSSTRIGFDPDDFCFASVRDYARDGAGATALIQHARSGRHQTLCHPIARTMARKMFGVFLKGKPLPATTGTPGVAPRGFPCLAGSIAHVKL